MCIFQKPLGKHGDRFTGRDTEEWDGRGITKEFILSQRCDAVTAGTGDVKRTDKLYDHGQHLPALR